MFKTTTADPRPLVLVSSASITYLTVHSCFTYPECHTRVTPSFSSYLSTALSAAVLTDELLIELLRALIMPFSSPWILNMFTFCSEWLDRRESNLNPGPWKRFRDRIPDPWYTTHWCISLTAPCPVPCSCQDAFSSTLPVPWSRKSSEATSALRAAWPWGIPSKNPSVRKANESNDIWLKTLSFSWIHSVLSPWPLRPKECHLLIIQGKIIKEDVLEDLYSGSSWSPSTEDYKGTLEDSKSSFKSSASYS